MKVVKMRCTNCDSRPVFVNQELEVCREKRCERCQIKLTVVSSEGQIDMPMPLRERRVLTQRETDEARRLLEPALEGLEV
jgi:hypothetical protein